MFPALDLTQFMNRTVMPSADVNLVESIQPGFTAQRINTQTSSLYSRLRKRYQRTIPFGQCAPLLLPAGPFPPAVSLTGRPILGAYLFVLEITTPGALGTAIFQWTSDGGSTWTTGVTTAATVALGTTGVSAVFSDVGTYTTSNSYQAASPIPEAFLDWLTVLVTMDLYDKRGHNPQDPALLRLAEREKEVRAEIKEAADGNLGLFDLPISDDETSALSSGEPLGYSEQSPYVWTTIQGSAARNEDRGGYGNGGCP